MKKGVEILLAAGTEIPSWIRDQTLGVKIAGKIIGGRRVCSLRIKGGEACFFAAGAVDLKMPGSGEFRTAFPPLKVLEIRSLRGKLLQHNHFLCEECFTNTGRRLKESPSKRIGKSDVVMQCTVCGNTWELKAV